MSQYTYRNLTSALKDRTSPLRRYFDRRFPSTRSFQVDVRAGAGFLRVDGGDANPGTLGAAFDYGVRLVLDPDHVPIPALRAFPDLSVRRAIEEVAAIGGAAVVTASDCDNDPDVARTCWALALCTEVYRRGPTPGSALDELIRTGRLTPDTLLGLAPDDAVRQLGELSAIAADVLIPALRSRGRVSLGPTFDGSRLCLADADVIAGDLLLEIKTHLGAKNPRTGVRSDSLAGLDLYQLIGYALFDRSDAYGIASVGLYSARYGNLIIWPLRDALNTLAGEEVDLVEERETVWRLLSGL